MKVNLDLTAAAAENLITDELKNNVGAAAFNMVHDFLYGGLEMEIWTAAGGTGTQLIETTDYTLGDIDAVFTSRAGRNVYTTVTVSNVTYQTGDLYFTYQATADYVDADDRYMVVRAAGQYWELTAGGAFEVYTTDATGDSILLDSAGGLDVNTVSGWEFSDTGGGYFWTGSGQTLLRSFDGLVTIEGTGTGGADFRTQGTGNVRVYTHATNTNVNALQLTTQSGGIDVDSVLGVNIKDLYGDTGTGNGITLLADNDNASGTGGDVTIQTAATSGTSGVILMESASAAVDAFTVNSAGGIEFYLTGTEGFYVEDSTNFSYFYMDPSGGSIDIWAEGASGYISLYSDLAAITIVAGAADVEVSAGDELDLNSANNIVLRPGGSLVAYTSGNSDIIDISSERNRGTPSLNTRIVKFSLDQEVTGIVLQSLMEQTSTTGPPITINTDNLDAGGTGGDININTTATAGTPGNILINSAGTGTAAIKIDSAGGIDVDSSGLMQFDAGEGSFYATGASGTFFQVNAATGQGGITLATNGANGFIDLDSATSITLDTGTDSADEIYIRAKGQGTGASATLRLEAQLGDIYQYTRRGIILLSEYNVAAGTGDGITITSDSDNATATGGDITIETTATLGTPGDIIIDSADDLTLRIADSTGTFWLENPTGNNYIYMSGGTSFTEILRDVQSAVTGGGIRLKSIVSDAGGTGGDILLQTTASAGTSGDIIIDSAGTGTGAITVDSDGGFALSADGRVTINNTSASDFIVIDSAGTGSNSIDINSSGGIDIDADAGIRLDENSTSFFDMQTGGNIILEADQDLTLRVDAGNFGTLSINTTGTLDIDGSAVQINSNGSGVTIDADTFTATIQTASAGATGILLNATAGATTVRSTSTTSGHPTLTIDQSDVDEPFLKFVGDAAVATLTNDLVAEADVATATRIGFVKIEILDDGNQITDGDYFVPFYSLT